MFFPAEPVSTLTNLLQGDELCHFPKEEAGSGDKVSGSPRVTQWSLDSDSALTLRPPAWYRLPWLGYSTRKDATWKDAPCRHELRINPGPRGSGEGHTESTTHWAVNQSQINMRALLAMQVLEMLWLLGESSNRHE